MRAIRPTAKAGAVDTRVADQTNTIQGFERLHVQITQSQYTQLKRIAFDRQISLAELARTVFREWLERTKQ